MGTRVEDVLLDGRWRPASGGGTFRAVDPTTGRPGAELWPTSGWADVETALAAAGAAAGALATVDPERIAAFFTRFAARLETAASELVALAHAETGLDPQARLTEVELPRMLDQLRQAAASVREGSWRMAMIDSRRNIRSAAVGLGPVVVLPPANFPFAYGCVTGGDFCAALAAGNPVIAKAHPGCPAVSRRAAVEALAVLHETGLPPATVQLLHGLEPAVGERLVADARVGGTGFTGGREAGQKLFAAAAAAGRVFWAELGSINPVVLLPGAVAERGPEIGAEFVASATGSAGQFCTKPGLLFVVDDAPGAALVALVADRFAALEPQVLLGPGGQARLATAVAGLVAAGARLVAGGAVPPAGGPCRHPPTLLSVSAAELLARPRDFIVEAFGNAALVVRCGSVAELVRAVDCVPGALAASIYAARDGADDDLFGVVARSVVSRAGRIVENRMPTGVAVTPPMQHGGPWPSAAPPFFSAVGLPFSILRFARRVCYDGWSQQRLPEWLRDAPPPGRPWRYVDGAWTRG